MIKNILKHLVEKKAIKNFKIDIFNLNIKIFFLDKTTAVYDYKGDIVLKSKIVKK
tara:strand:- start:22 stop:186 length:165 start_codon:yes stop_codon:yes gene_type:complete